MNIIKRCWNLMRDFWVIFTIFAILNVHIIMVYCTNIDDDLIHFLFGEGLPLIGGVVILLSLNKDVQDFRNVNLFSFYMNRLKSYSSKRRDYVLATSSISFAAKFRKIRGTVQRRCNTPEERFKELERRIEELSEYISEVDKGAIKELGDLRKDVDSLMEKKDEEVMQVTQRLDRAIIGNIDFHVFGVILIFYGFILNIILMY